jgi:glycosyltransferase involved in cell wall biosynthesis
LGYLVASSSFKARLLRLPIWNAFRFLLNRPGSRVLLQNAEDREFVTTKIRVPLERTVLIRGAGVDCNVFHPGIEREGVPVVMLPSRMLWNKGIAEFVEAARLLKQEGVNARFVLVGDVDGGSPSGMPRETLLGWRDAGVIEWCGPQQQMADVYQSATLVCLPSHGGEGVPKVLLEAASCGRAIVTSDVPGCRDIVRHNVNGLVVPPKTVRELATAVRYLLENDDVRRQMGASGREIALREFSQEIVVNKTMSLYNELVGTEVGYAAAATTAG